jgi:methyl-accepting chemotaxis protein
MFKNMRLSLKLAVGFGLVIVALIVVGATGYFKISGVQTVVADLSGTHIPLIKVAFEIDTLATEQELAATQYAIHKEEAFLAKFDDLDKLVDQKFEKGKALVNADQELVDEGWLKPIEKMAAQHDVFVKSCRSLMAAVKTGKPKEEWDIIADDVAKQSESLMKHVDGFLDMNDKETVSVATVADSAAVSAHWIIGVVGLASVFAGILLAFFIGRGITKPIHRVISGLNTGSEQVAAASGQVSAASQSLAEGSSEQAASLEETSASLEEMSSMTKTNAENSGQADLLMKDANQVISGANQSMTDLTHSMTEISEASEQTSKIIKTIDEIAFQTNLLALNAAVEAARAGEAGAGFAVVADEVRNLALRAAEAARNTAELIEGTVKRVNDGTTLVEKTNAEFSKVAESALKVGELVSEISAASNEQAQGIEEVNKAVGEMDRVTQQNAANAEESASASEEMNAQAEELKGYVNDLITLVGGKADQAYITHDIETPRKASGKAKALAAPGRKKAARKAVNPEEILPLDDKEFKDF